MMRSTIFLARYGLPTVFALFTLVYSIVAVKTYNKEHY